MNNIIGWWLAYTQGWIDAYRARLGVSLHTPALRESVNRRFPERPFSVGVDLAQGEDRAVVSIISAGKVVRHLEVVRG